MGAEDHPLRIRRENLRLRLVDVARRAGVSTPLVSMLENGYLPKKRASLELVAAAVDATVEDLWPTEGP